jgi:hypothetical protein
MTVTADRAAAENLVREDLAGVRLEPRRWSS